jgi:hypothetical protein
MKSRLFACGVLALTFAALPLIFRAQTPASDSALTAHEWGTFTSIAGRDGRAADWLPLTGSTDLPTFVEHFQTPDFKGGLRGTVRMETPVPLFLYQPSDDSLGARLFLAGAHHRVVSARESRRARRSSDAGAHGLIFE